MTGLVALGRHGTGIDGSWAGVLDCMDIEHTGVETGALDAYSRIVTGVA